jgi:DNA-binding GntR family transcriptional regulator
MSGQIWPGEFIRLDDVAKDLGVSVTPVREALLTLRGEDMVQLEPRRGYVVSPLSRQDIKDLFRLQGDIAGELATRAASRVTPAQLDELRAVQVEIADAVRTSHAEDIERLEHEFHRLVNRIAEARKLAWFLHTATRYTPARFYSADPAWRANMLVNHEALLQAFADRDVATAREAMVRHFTDGAERLIDHLDGIGLWSAGGSSREAGDDSPSAATA